MDSKDLMDEHKHIKRGFVLATLISTVAGTFITGINLYDRLLEQRRQKKLDKGQNKKIKELEERLSEAEAEKKKRDEEGANGGKDGPGTHNDVRNSLQHSSDAVQQEYERYFANLGSRFAQGDLVAQTQLQSQIILLQGSVIKLLEEALMTGTMPDINRLYNTCEFAREGSLRALHDQYQRLLESSAPPPPQQRHRHGGRPGGRPTGPVRRISSTPSLRDFHHPSSSSTTTADSTIWPSGHMQRRQLAPPPPPPQPRKQLAAAYASSSPSDLLFCRLAQETQRTDRPLDSCLATDNHSPSSPSSSSSSSICTACGAQLGPEAWRIEKEVALHRGPPEDDESGSGSAVVVVVVRTYLLTRRFLFKCHRPMVGGGTEYACYLCLRHRDRDTICRTEEGLVSHVTKRHGVAEYEADRDIREVGGGGSGSGRRALPFR
ncbi:hypothetical protein N658DRAFT_250769 [Parathielavia hyrcaniae]|uniref:Uncharacterized protein n=1 Tax=Parathielavia hyrcaniae TaxID=113614 RepID=A0AAN6T417_9PEZI|nr:hypothetical protein N658DRAFT_250769 [Parathielavia hyrcaniae]